MKGGYDLYGNYYPNLQDAIDAEIEQIKEEMKKYRDFYGGDLFESEDIDKATTKEELREIIEHHRDHMCSMLSDAYGHLDRFTERVKLRDIDL